MDNILEKLEAVLEERRQASPDSSYVASLHDAGMDKILKKVGEESAEVLIAAKAADLGGSLDDVVYETADLWFHSLVMLSHLGLSHKQVLKELERRFGLSGIEEKASRSLTENSARSEDGRKLRIKIRFCEENS